MVEISRQPARRGVAVVAVGATINVPLVLACRDDAVVAGSAGSDDLRVIDRKDGNPDIRCVAVLADVAGLDVGQVLASGLGAVVAAETIAGDVDVIEVCRHPACRGVAVVAVGATGDMRGVLAGCGEAVVTGAAGTQYLRVIDSIGWCPDVAVMAVFADVAGLDVCDVLTRSLHAVVAADAIADDADVVKSRRAPGIRCVAVITGIAAVDMSRVLTRRRDTVVARAAGPDHLRMVDREYRREYVRVVAVLADVACLDMRLVLAGRLNAVVTVDAVADDIHMVEIRR